eukprot:TRINITY_DN1232_c0_g1_i1.p1 TRINITY_DN1232_c0_g1~~TRINITY_DN1232_c0_g1_i1.p1  ORF type:complete len:212 (-),score=44.65 TRINITY_DN1232_c0_g1_i1:29-628(-)
MKSAFILAVLLSVASCMTFCSTNVGNCWPIQYTCDKTAAATEPNPELSWSPVAGAGSYIVFMFDITNANKYIHWIMKDIPASITSVAKGASGNKPPGKDVKVYQGPCGGPENNYVINVYAIRDATTTYPFSNGNGLSVNADLKALSLDYANMTVINYRNSQRPANQQYNCPDVAHACDPSSSSATTLIASTLALLAFFF